MSDFLGVNIYDRSDDGLAKKVSALHDWASDKTGNKDINAILTEVTKLQKSLGVHFIGKPLVSELYKHMRLSQVNQKPQATIQEKVPSMRPKKNDSIKKVIKQEIQSTIKQAIKEAFI